MPRGSALKKTALASEQDRPDIARKRARWKARQGSIDLRRLVFLDETWAKTNMAPLRGWALRGQRLIGHAPFGHWNTRPRIKSGAGSSSPPCATTASSRPG